MIDLEAIHASKERNKHRASSIDLCIFSMLLCVVTVLGWLVKKCPLKNYVHESGLALMTGLITGGVIVAAIRNEPGPINHTVQYEGNWSHTVPDELFMQMPNSTVVYEYRYPLLATEGSDIARKTIFDPEIFFNIILPLLIFETGLRLEKINFFKNLDKIIVLAIFGTLLSTVVTILLMVSVIKLFKVPFSIVDILLFSTIISATDPVAVLSIFKQRRVNADLNALVTGESILNDAVCITIANAIEAYQMKSMLFGKKFTAQSLIDVLLEMTRVISISVATGVGVALLNSLVFKFARIRNSSLVENTIFILLSYCSFLATEICQATGVVAALFCGMVQSHYTERNMSCQSVSMLHQFLSLFSFLAENFTFVYIGISLMTHQVNRWSPIFTFGAIVAIFIARCVSVYSLSAIMNQTSKHPVPFQWQHMLVFAGTRGAVAFALAIRGLSSEFRQIMLTTTSCIILLTVLTCGSLAFLMMEVLHLTDNSEVNNVSQVTDGPPSDNEMIVICDEDVRARVRESSWLIRQWQKLDMWYLTPIFTNEGPLLEDTVPRCLLPLGRLLTSRQQRLNVIKARRPPPDREEEQ